LTLEIPGEEPVSGLYLGITSNTSPWTYFRSQPIVLTDDASFDRGLDLVTLDRLGLLGTLWAAGGMLTKSGIRGRHTQAYRNLSEFRLTATEPMHLQVDGDYLGHCESASFRAVPRAITVVA
jgi:diacylglycerol kinase family enzyme